LAVGGVGLEGGESDGVEFGDELSEAALMVEVVFVALV
jgi:hypothetical protein